MLNKLAAFIREYDMVQPGDTLVCAVSGGADSVALLFALYLLKDTVGFSLEAAHFNHQLRGAESDQDAEFVKNLCAGYGIPLHCGRARVQPGEKGLEAAARDARYGFFETLPGKIVTAHTCDDNAETVLMHLVRGTGLKGLGGIAPVRGRFLRPMLTVSRQEVLDLLQEYHLTYREDSSNASDDFLRNRLRHHVMPLLLAENPEFSANTSAMAQRLRQDEQTLEALTGQQELTISQLRQLQPALRSRYISRFLQAQGVREPEARHIALAESLIFSENPSAEGNFPGNIRIRRCYDTWKRAELPREREVLCVQIQGPGQWMLPQAGLILRVSAAENRENTPCRFTVPDSGEITVRCRRSGDRICTPGGTKSLKKLFIDKKIPADLRSRIPVVAAGDRVLGVWGVGADLQAYQQEPGWVLDFISEE